MYYRSKLLEICMKCRDYVREESNNTLALCYEVHKDPEGFMVSELRLYNRVNGEVIVWMNGTTVTAKQIWNIINMVVRETKKYPAAAHYYKKQSEDLTGIRVKKYGDLD